MSSNSSPVTKLLKTCSVILLILAIGVEYHVGNKYLYPANEVFSELIQICVGKAWGLKTTLPQTPHSAGRLRYWVRPLHKSLKNKVMVFTSLNSLSAKFSCITFLTNQMSTSPMLFQFCLLFQNKVFHLARFQLFKP